MVYHLYILLFKLNFILVLLLNINDDHLNKIIKVIYNINLNLKLF